MTQKLFHRLLAGGIFLVSAVQFLLTAQPTVSFWDPGELSAAAYMLQVPHPPGGPLFSLTGKLFFLLPFPGNIGFRMNMVSVLASAVSVLFLYLVAVRVIRLYQGAGKGEHKYTTCISAAIGALALSFCDTFWFNGVESNYFAASTLLFSAMMWLVLLWYEHYDEPGNDRYLLLIAYLVGLSGGVHLMSVPSLFVVVVIVAIRTMSPDDTKLKQSAYILLGHIALLLAVTYGMWSALTGKQAPSDQDLQGYDIKFVLIMAAISALVVVVFRKRVLIRDSVYVPLSIAAVALAIAYPGVIKKLPQAIHLVSGDDSTMGALILFLVLGALGALAYWSAKRKKNLLNLASLGTLFVVLGFSTYTMIVIRANVHPPMNENNPKNFSSLLTYLNREQYGDFPIFERRWTTDPERQKTFTAYTSDFDFFLRYQMNHMFVRYILFNFSGRDSRDQDADWNVKQLYAIPLIVGLFGLYWHFRKDWKMASSLVILFVLMGFLIAFYQNQQEPQPREREYFYPGAYFVFALWIALGIQGIVEIVKQSVRDPRMAKAAVGCVFVLGVAFIPARMFKTNLFTHDRSKNWVPREYAYNMLQSCEKDAVLFTNGDNDTFPLWYLQDVEGIRRDVRVVNLSLANTPWYIQEFKDKPYYTEAQAVPITIPDARIATIQPVYWDPKVVRIPVPKDAYAQFGITDSSVINKGEIAWTMPNTFQSGHVKGIRIQDILVLNIIQSFQWKRPVYFAVTCPPDSKIGLDDYLKFCGLTWRLVPEKSSHQNFGMDREVLSANLLDEGTTFYTTPHYGYRFGSLADTTVYLDENEVRSVGTYRSLFRGLVSYYAEMRPDSLKRASILERMDAAIPEARIPLTIDEKVEFATLNEKAGRVKRFNELAESAEKQFADIVQKGRVANPYIYAAMIQLYDDRGEYQKELDLLNDLVKKYPGDPYVKQKLAETQAKMAVPKP